jgi:hypothetical protein
MTPPDESQAARSPSGPSQGEVIMLAGLACVIFVGVISLLTNYFVLVDGFADSSAYMSVGSAIRRWDFHGLSILQFWGLPYLMALTSILTRASDRTSLLLISFVSYFVSIWLAHRLWGGWVAGFFAVINFDWMQRAFLGGAEPLFVALLLASFLMVRRQRWLPAALLASLSTIVRPLGFLALAAVGIALLWRREYRKLASAALLALVIGSLYIWPLWRYFGNPLAPVTAYQYVDPSTRWIFGFPFYAIIKGTLMYPSPWTNLVLSFGWILFVLTGILAMFMTKHFRDYAKAYPVEVIFAGGYLFLLFCYNSPIFARGNFARFAVPVIPFVAVALYAWIPKSRPALWVLGAISPVLAACSAVGINNVLHMLAH